jgi:hypothetical protein
VKNDYIEYEQINFYVMILKKITPENIDSLDWFDKVYILENPINNPNENPKVSQILSFFEGDSNFNLLDDNFYCSNMIRF